MLKAQSDFDRVQLAPTPSLRDTSACVQTQAALLTVALPEDLPLVHFRKGYCTLAGAALRHDKADFHAAAAEFDKAIETWPGRAAVMTKKAAAGNRLFGVAGAGPTGAPGRRQRG